MSKRTKDLLRANNAWEKEHLSKENQQLMTDIVVYIRSAAISEYEQELVRRDIMTMLAAGAHEGRSAEEVIGEDAQAFCNEVIAALPPRPAGERALTAHRAAGVCGARCVLAGVWRSGRDRCRLVAVLSAHCWRCDWSDADLCYSVHYFPWHFPAYV